MRMVLNFEFLVGTTGKLNKINRSINKTVLVLVKHTKLNHMMEFVPVNGKPSQSPPVPCQSGVASPGHNKTMSTTSGTYKINLLSGAQERP